MVSEFHARKMFVLTRFPSWKSICVKALLLHHIISLRLHRVHRPVLQGAVSNESYCCSMHDNLFKFMSMHTTAWLYGLKCTCENLVNSEIKVYRIASSTLTLSFALFEYLPFLSQEQVPLADLAKPLQGHCKPMATSINSLQKSCITHDLQ